MPSRSAELHKSEAMPSIVQQGGARPREVTKADTQLSKQRKQAENMKGQQRHQKSIYSFKEMKLLAVH